MEFDEIVDVVDSHLQHQLLHDLSSRKTQTYQLLDHLLSLQLQKLNFRNDGGKILALFYLFSNEFAFSSLQRFLFLVGFDSFPLHVVHKLRRYFGKSLSS